MKKHEMEDANWVDQRMSLLSPDEDWQPDVAAGLARFKARSRPSHWAIRRWIWVAATLAAACLFLLPLPTPRMIAHRCLQCTAQAWQALAEPFPPTTSVNSGKTRKGAPDFALIDATGKEIRLSDMKGQVVLVNFWATWCHGCQVEIPWFIQFKKEYKDRGFAIIGVSMDDDGWKSVKPWIAEMRVNYPIVIGNGDLGKQYGLIGMPLSVLVDREGKVADVHSGVINRSAEQQEIETLLAESSNALPK